MSVSAHGIDLSPIPSVGLCVSARKVYCGKTANWIQMPFGMVNGVGRGIRVLDGVHVPQLGKGGLGVCPPHVF